MLISVDPQVLLNTVHLNGQKVHHVSWLIAARTDEKKKSVQLDLGGKKLYFEWVKGSQAGREDHTTPGGRWQIWEPEWDASRITWALQKMQISGLSPSTPPFSKVLIPAKVEKTGRGFWESDHQIFAFGAWGKNVQTEAGFKKGQGLVSLWKFIEKELETDFVMEAYWCSCTIHTDKCNTVSVSTLSTEREASEAIILVLGRRRLRTCVWIYRTLIST